MKTAISLGWDCGPSVYSVENGLRVKKEQGYKTCPFDWMITNYNGIIECIKDDFKFLCDPEYLKVITITDKYNYLNFPINSTVIVNTKYKFIMNHESSGHGNLFKDEGWPKGKYHFEMNNFEELIIRYTNRIKNFKYYMENEYEVTFVISKVNNTIETNKELDKIVREKYPNTKIDFLLIEEERKEIFMESIFLAKQIDKYCLYSVEDDYKVCFMIANKYIRNYPSFIDHYVENIQNCYKNSLILIIDNNSDNFEDINIRLKKYENNNLVIITNTSESKFELGAYKFGINYIINNNLLSKYDYYIFTQDTFVLKNKFDFYKFIENNVFACPIKCHIDDNFNRHSNDYYDPLVSTLLHKLNLQNNINDLRLCWANSFVLHNSKVKQFYELVKDIITKNKTDACLVERLLSPILYTLNNYKNYTLDNIYTEQEIYDLWSIDVKNTNTHYHFMKKLTNKH